MLVCALLSRPGVEVLSSQYRLLVSPFWEFSLLFVTLGEDLLLQLVFLNFCLGIVPLDLGKDVTDAVLFSLAETGCCPSLTTLCLEC